MRRLGLRIVLQVNYRSDRYTNENLIYLQFFGSLLALMGLESLSRDTFPGPKTR
jgi:hypothetical protein